MADALASCIDELRTERLHGGSFMARRAVEALAEAADEPAETSEELLERLVAAGRELAAARPAMGAIAGAVGRVLAAASHGRHLPPEELARLVHEEAEGLIGSRDRAAASIAIQLRPALVEATVLTHSASATVREAVLVARPYRVICTASAPIEEGRAFAESLRAEGLEVELVEDEDALEALGRASILLVGADTVFRTGDVVNKIGTRPLAEAATHAGVRTVVACELIKLAPVDPPSPSPESELFDLTPAPFVDEIVTEEGALVSEDVAALIDRTPFLREGYALLR